MTLPMTLIVISGEIDLSVASILGMSQRPARLPVGQALADARASSARDRGRWALAAGAVNGLLVTRLGLPSLAVTIGTLALYRGIATILLGPNTVANFPAAYTNLGVNAVPFTGNDLTYSAAIFIVLAIIFGVVLHATPFGRSVYAMGASTEAAQFAGIRVKRIKTVLFMTSGLVCAAGRRTAAPSGSTPPCRTTGSAWNSTWSRSSCSAGCRSSAARAPSSAWCSACSPSPGIQNALFLTNFNQEAAGIVTGALLLLSVFGRNAGVLLGRLRAWLPAGRRGRGPDSPAGGPPPTAITPT